MYVDRFVADDGIDALHSFYSDAINKANKTLPVKNSSNEDANARLMLFRAARTVLAKGLAILGIKPLKAM